MPHICADEPKLKEKVVSLEADLVSFKAKQGMRIISLKVCCVCVLVCDAWDFKGLDNAVCSLVTNQLRSADKYSASLQKSMGRISKPSNAAKRTSRISSRRKVR